MNKKKGVAFSQSDSVDTSLEVDKQPADFKTGKSTENQNDDSDSSESEVEYKVKQDNEWYSSSLNFATPSVDEIIRHCIDEIWIRYDDDNNGYLDREETRAFIRDSLKGEDDGGREEDEEEDKNITDK